MHTQWSCLIVNHCGFHEENINVRSRQRIFPCLTIAVVINRHQLTSYTYRDAHTIVDKFSYRSSRCLRVCDLVQQKRACILHLSMSAGQGFISKQTSSASKVASSAARRAESASETGTLIDPSVANRSAPWIDRKAALVTACKALRLWIWTRTDLHHRLLWVKCWTLRETCALSMQRSWILATLTFLIETAIY